MGAGFEVVSGFVPQECLSHKSYGEDKSLSRWNHQLSFRVARTSISNPKWYDRFASRTVCFACFINSANILFKSTRTTLYLVILMPYAQMKVQSLARQWLYTTIFQGLFCLE
jgi:hypothetical protein